MSNKKRVALVLGSGGARGMAHIGVIRCLEDHDYEIVKISGASIGALVGGFYAAGQLDIFQSWVCALDRKDVLRLVDLSFTGGGFFKGAKLMDALSNLVKDQVIETLPIDFTAVAVDLKRQKEVWFTEGSLFEAIRGSISIPSVFRPHAYRNMLLVDGGVLNPVPVSAVMGSNAGDVDVTFAVNLNARQSYFSTLATRVSTTSLDTKEKKGVQNSIRRFIERWKSESNYEDLTEEKYSTLRLLNRSIEIMQNTIAHMKLTADIPDALIEIPCSLGGMLDYHMADRFIEIGYQQCWQVINRPSYYEPQSFDDELPLIAQDFEK